MIFSLANEFWLKIVAKAGEIQTIAVIDWLKQADPTLIPLIEQYAPYPFRTQPDQDNPDQDNQDDVFSGLAKAILYQSISIKAANTVYARLLQLYPAQSLPGAIDLLNTPEATLQSIGLPLFKVRYLQALAQASLAGLPTLEQLSLLEDEAIIRLLTPIKGIGRWSVQMLLIFQLKRLDVLPVADLGIRAAIRDLYHLKALPDKLEVEAIGAKWQPYRTVACWYLWQSRDEAARNLLQAWS